MEIRQIPLNELVEASEGMAIRQTFDADRIKTLSKNIQQFGLLQPLLVRPLPDGTYEVIDGNRRLLALRAIGNEPDQLVNCIVHSKAGKGEALSANVMREDMNPMDVYDVYAGLIANGADRRGLQRVFGKTKREIAQILALAGLHPTIKEDLREGKIGWETAQALTTIRDQERQLVIYDEAGDSDWRVREIIGRAQPNLAHALFDRDEYLKRGGTILVDLFSEQQNNKPQLCEDKELFWELQNAGIEKEIAGLLEEGWLTVVNANGGEKIKLDMNWPWREQITTKKQRKLHTLFYEVDSEGEFVLLNRVKPTAKLVEKAKAEKLLKKLEESAEAGEPIEVAGGKPMSQTLIEQLKHVRSVQVKAALVMNPNLAARVLLMMLMQGRNGHRYGAAATDMFWSDCKPLPGSIEKHEAWATQQGEYEQLGDLMVADGWAQVLGESDRGILDRLAYIATRAINAHYPGAGELINAILQQQPVAARAVWQPTAEFWKQTGRAFMLKILGEIAGEGVAARFKNEKVKDLAVKMERWFTKPEENSWLNFNGKDEPLPNDIVDAFKSWVPAILQVPTPNLSLWDIFHEESSTPINYEIDEEKQAAAEEAAAAEE